ncbi:MAG: hypothetical protein WBR13_09960 [Allosphingosinicella sp.]
MQTSPPRRTTVERAFELASSGECDNLPDIVAALKGERHESVDAHLAGPSIRKDLRRVWEAQAKDSAAAAGEGSQA